MNALTIGFLQKNEEKIDLGALAEEQTLGWQIKAFNLPKIWEKDKGAGVKVAVLDTAVDLNHPDLKIEGGWDFVNDKELSQEVPAQGHGTHVAGIIGARDNGKGIVGVAPEASLFSCVVLGEDGSGSYDWIAKAIDWCIREKMDVINMSLGGGMDTPDFYKAIRRAYDAGIPIIAAAGNSSWETGYADFPATYNETIAVPSINKNMKLSYFSSIGSNLDVAAPGSDILSTTPLNTYSVYSGTSMATPFVSGIVALMIAKHRKRGGNTPIGSVEDIREHLIDEAVDLDYKGQDSFTGYGLINPAGIMEDEEETKEIPVEPEEDLSFDNLAEGVEVKFKYAQVFEGWSWKKFWFKKVSVEEGEKRKIKIGRADMLELLDE